MSGVLDAGNLGWEGWVRLVEENGRHKLKDAARALNVAGRIEAGHMYYTHAKGRRGVGGTWIYKSVLSEKLRSG